MKKTFVNKEREAQSQFKERSSTVSAGAKVPGSYGSRAYPFILPKDNWKENLFPGIRDQAAQYFTSAEIAWHHMSHHLLSSQVCCLNFLMPFATRPEALTTLLKPVFGPDLEVLPIDDDDGVPSEERWYVAFEWIAGNYLRESSGDPDNRKRGANCTSADAAVKIRRGGVTEFVLIEWKYTESYSFGAPLPGSNETRRQRYHDLVFGPDGPIRGGLSLELDHFFHEPVYQLLRQQMLAYQIEKHREQGSERASVLHISPAANSLLRRVTAPELQDLGEDVLQVWPALLCDPDRFRSVSIEKLFGSFNPAPYPELVEWYGYVRDRYGFAFQCGPEDSDALPTIASAFSARFKHWDLVLPQQDLIERSAGQLSKAGWSIQYCFGSAQKGEYLDYYASHRMTDDSHERLYEDGSLETLPAIEGMFLTSSDPVEAKRLEEEHLRRNREIAEALAAKGFGFNVNMALRSGLIDT